MGPDGTVSGTVPDGVLLHVVDSDELVVPLSVRRRVVCKARELRVSSSQDRSFKALNLLLCLLTFFE